MFIIKSNIENFNILQEEENKKSIDIEMTVTDDDDDIDDRFDCFRNCNGHGSQKEC